MSTLHTVREDLECNGDLNRQFASLLYDKCHEDDENWEPESGLRDCHECPTVNETVQKEEMNQNVPFNNDEYAEEYDEYDEDFSEDDYYEEHGRELQKNKVAGSYGISQNPKVSSYQPNDKFSEKFRNKICLEKFSGLKYNANVVNKVEENERKEINLRYRVKDKRDRATCEQALDAKTMLILQSFLVSKFIHQIHGCFSTGKEANVYYGADELSNEYAIKVYKTSILVFKDRDKYVSGDFKNRNSYGKSNPRKMVQKWAEKEFSNLHKLHVSGIRVPKPTRLKNNVLVMEFIGFNSYPAPRLKDADISSSKARELYLEIVVIMWTMYNECKLVHADLSEFNILYIEGNLCIIDVSQAVTPEHTNSFEFLRSDCKNITDFFRKKGVPTMTVKELFTFIVDPTITKKNRDFHLDLLQETSSNRDPFNISEQEKTDENIFINSFIPKHLDQVTNFERDFRNVRIAGNTNVDMLYPTVLGLKEDLSGAKPTDDPESDSDDESNEEVDTEELQRIRRPLGRPKEESTEDRKLRKKAARDIKSDKRLVKMKKHEKKRAVKTSRKK